MNCWTFSLHILWLVCWGCRMETKIESNNKRSYLSTSRCCRILLSLGDREQLVRYFLSSHFAYLGPKWLKISLDTNILVPTSDGSKRSVVQHPTRIQFKNKYSENFLFRQVPSISQLIKGIRFVFFFFYRLLDSMKVPGQRSSFHICDILDLNNASDTKSSQNNNNNNNTSNNNNSTNTSFPSQASPPPSRDGDSITNLNDSIASTGSSTGAAPLVPPPPPPYQLPSNLSSAIYSELGHHYQSMFPSVGATKSWIKEHEHYGE